LSDIDRKKAVIDKFLRGDISNKQALSMLEYFQPKGLNQKNEFKGYA